MPRAPRERSEGDIYHVFARGVGRQLIFEDDDDCSYFLSAMKRALDQCEGSLLAWVLMGNHFHLLLHMQMDMLSEFMKRLQVSYANYFNKRHDRVGHLFQGRFGSQPITSEEQLMAVVRYIHRNPVEAGLCGTCDYKWSSFRSYLQGAAVTETDSVMSLFEGLNHFVEFHQEWDSGRFTFLDVTSSRRAAGGVRVPEAEARTVADNVLGIGWKERLPTLSAEERRSCLRDLKTAGLSQRQVERLTGISRKIISKA